MKKIVSLFLACLLLLCALVGCNDTPPDVSGDGGNTAGGNETVKAETLTVAGADISAYTIVYTLTYSADLRDAYGEILGEDYEHSRVTAYELADLLYETLGVRLAVKSEGEGEVSREILIGATNREASASVTVSQTDAYAVSVVGEKLVVTGGSDGAVYHALDAIEAALTKSKSKDLAWGEGAVLSGNAPLRHIACIGDSITEGAIGGGAVTAEFSYPAHLQRMLWQDAAVYNYGLGGTTMINSSAKPYMSSQQYTDCLTSGVAYDVILVMLGTNDSKVIGDTWTEEANEEFMACAETLFASLKAKSPNARFAYMNCPVKFTSAGYANAYMLPVQKEAAALLLSEGYDVTHYDMRAYTTEFMTEESFASDLLHPTREGYYTIAEGVCELVYHLLDGDENEYIIPLD